MIKILGTEHQGLFNIDRLEEECSKNKYNSVFIEYHTSEGWRETNECPEEYAENFSYTEPEDATSPEWYSLEVNLFSYFSSEFLSEEQKNKLVSQKINKPGIDFKTAVESAVKTNKRVIAIDEDLPELYNQLTFEEYSEFNRNIVKNILLLGSILKASEHSDINWKKKNDILSVLNRNLTHKGSSYKIREIKMASNIIKNKKENENSLVVTGDVHIENIKSYLEENTDEKIKCESLVIDSL